MRAIGIVEGFFGPQWPMQDRVTYAPFLQKYGADFYIYAPKQDPRLRKDWRETWDDAYLETLKRLCDQFQKHNVRFGVGFSPFGLGTRLLEDDEKKLKEKAQVFTKLGIDLIGLFFDDMPVTDNLAQTQLQTIEVIKTSFDKEVIFCPSFYTFDPILDKVFGKRPANYLEDLGTRVPSDVAIAWTGPKVISPSMSEEHLIEVSGLLRRRPFIWENLYANDGPKNCKFLKLRTFNGRSPDIMNHIDGMAFNLMNQPHLSKIVFLSSLYVLRGERDVDMAFFKACTELCTPELQRILFLRKDTYLNKGLDAITPADNQRFQDELRGLADPAAKEIIAWLKGEFVVGPECLTD